MILPTKLEITNYCQIPHLKLDLTKNGTYAITAPNATGKSNVLNALRFAFSGAGKDEKSPLEEDIRDFQDAAIVTLWFDYDGGGMGRVTRTITRSGTKVELELQCGTERELITKSRAAEARFNELLGAPPKALCDVIIAPQMEIEALLFWPAKQRASKFQRFLNGPLFSQIEKIIADEKSRVILDELATERLAVLQEELHKEIKHQAEIKKAYEAAEKILQSKTCLEALELQNKIQQHKLHRARLLELTENLTLKKEAAAQLDALLLTPHAIVALTNEITTFSKTKELWVAWDTYSSWINLKNKLETDIEEASNSIKSAEKAAQDLPALISQLAELEAALKQARAYAQQQNELNALAKLKTAEQEKSAIFTQAVKEESEAQDKFRVFYDSVAVLREALKALESTSKSHTHKENKACCPVCQSPISADIATEIRARAKEREAQLVPLSQEVKAKEEARREAERQLNLIRGELSAILAKVSQHQTITPPKETIEALEKKVNEYNTKLGEIKTIANTLPALQAKIASRRKELEELIKNPPQKATKPTIPRQELTALQTKAQAAENAIAANTKYLSQKAAIQAVIDNLNTQIATLQTQAKEQKLPSLHMDWALSDKETAALQYLLNAQQAMEQARTDKASVDSRVAVLQEQVAQVEQQITGYEDSKKYLETLKQLGAEFSPTGLPQRILRFQLHHLCAQMDSIIAKFQLRAPFKIHVDEDLDLFMVYPTGIKRRISRASGAERIILGLAFRLAAHRYLSPEAPFIAIDEPTNHLDESNIVVLQDLFRFLRDNIGEFGLKKILFCTHSKALAAEAAVHIDLSSLHQQNSHPKT
jgi:exonuclease SbcC